MGEMLEEFAGQYILAKRHRGKGSIRLARWGLGKVNPKSDRQPVHGVAFGFAFQKDAGDLSAVIQNVVWPLQLQTIRADEIAKRVVERQSRDKGPE